MRCKKWVSYFFLYFRDTYKVRTQFLGSSILEHARIVSGLRTIFSVRMGVPVSYAEALLLQDASIKSFSKLLDAKLLLGKRKVEKYHRTHKPELHAQNSHSYYSHHRATTTHLEWKHFRYLIFFFIFSPWNSFVSCVKRPVTVYRWPINGNENENTIRFHVRNENYM